MSRNLKPLGLALVAMLAMSAVAASTASAKTNGLFTAESYPVILDGAPTATGAGQFTSEIFNIECHTTVYNGPTISGPVSSLEVTPETSGCTAGTRGVTFTHNECRFKFYNATDTDASGNTTPDTWKFTTDLVCPVNKKVEVHIYNNASHASGTFCTLTMFAANNKNLEGLTAHVNTNTPESPDDILVTGSVPVVEETHGTCSFGFTIGANATLDVSGTATGTSEAGTPTSIGIS